MSKVVLYGSTGQNRGTSKVSSSSSSFKISSQTPLYPNKTKPLSASKLDANSKNATPKNVYINYNLEGKDSIGDIRSKLMQTLNLSETTAQRTFTKYTEYYNRFKLPTLNDALQKGFAHVFFTRPDCNILNDTGTALNDSFMADPEFYYTWKNSPDVLKQLTLGNGQSHHFMLSLSNKAASFSLSDEYINTDTYGKSYKGWQIAYGRNNVESKTAGDFSITYNDDRTLHIYQLHRLWVDYISEVYQGRKSPLPVYILQKMLDYASSCYYILTAEDGETIIFWTKYYGVFPTTIPSNQYSWAHNNIISNPQPEIKYHFSFKEDMNPEALSEFNFNANINGSTTYVPTYDKSLGHVGTTWVGAPFIELVTNDSEPECPYTFKLRFRPTKSTATNTSGAITIKNTSKVNDTMQTV